MMDKFINTPQFQLLKFSGIKTFKEMDEMGIFEEEYAIKIFGKRLTSEYEIVFDMILQGVKNE